MSKLLRSIVALFQAETGRGLSQSEAEEIATIVNDYCPESDHATPDVLTIVNKLVLRTHLKALSPVPGLANVTTECLTNILDEICKLSPSTDWDDSGESVLGKFPNLGIILYICREGSTTEYAIRPHTTLEILNSWLVSVRQMDGID